MRDNGMADLAEARMAELERTLDAGTLDDAGRAVVMAEMDALADVAVRRYENASSPQASLEVEDIDLEALIADADRIIGKQVNPDQSIPPSRKEIPARVPATPSEVEQARSYFDPQAINSAINQDMDSRETLAYMSPEDFLSMARKGESKEKAATVSALMERGEKFNDLPFLSFEHDGNGSAWVVGHEGRHRAKALAEAGVARIPVILRSQDRGIDGPGIRFGEQGTGSPNDLISQGYKLPTKLRGEKDYNGDGAGNDHVQMVFPYATEQSLSSNIPAMDSTPEQSIIAERPDMRVANEDGTVTTAAEALAKADEEIARAEQDASLFDAAINCFLRFGDED